MSQMALPERNYIVPRGKGPEEMLELAPFVLSRGTAREYWTIDSSSARLPAAGREMKTQGSFHFSRSTSLINLFRPL